VQPFPAACNGVEMRFLIAGSSGFLGTLLRRRLQAEGHTVTRLVRRPPAESEVQWDPYSGPLGTEVVDRHDVVVNIAGSRLTGNPHSKRWAEEMVRSRVATTGVMAEAIAASATKPAFLVGNGSSWYGDCGESPLIESEPSTGEAFMTNVTRQWQAATSPASEAGARVCVLRSAPVIDRRNLPWKLMFPAFRLGIGGMAGSGEQYVPIISARDWVDAAIHVAGNESVSGPVNMSCPETPRHREFVQGLGRLLHRPTVLRVPGAVVKVAAGRMAPEVLGSTRPVPQVLLDSGYDFADPDVRAVLREGLDPSR